VARLPSGGHFAHGRFASAVDSLRRDRLACSRISESHGHLCLRIMARYVPLNKEQ